MLIHFNARKHVFSIMLASVFSLAGWLLPATVSLGQAQAQTRTLPDFTDLVEMVLIAPLSQADGTITHYVSVQDDITEKKQLAEELEKHRHHLEELVEQRTEQLVEAQERADEIAAGVAAK